MGDLGLSRWDWLLISVAISTLGSLLTWLVSERSGVISQTNQAWVHTLTRILQNPWLVHTSRLLYAVGIPAIALFWQHTLTARGLGLRPPPASQVAGEGIPTMVPPYPDATWEAWALDAGWMLALTTATVLLIYLGDRAARRRAAATATAPNAPKPAWRRRDLGVAVREAVFHQVHWAFYREPFVIRWGTTVGSWMGTLPVLLETLLSPVFWERLRSRDEAYRRTQIIRWGLLAAGTLVYLKTQNLWLALTMDALVGWLALPAGSTPEA